MGQHLVYLAGQIQFHKAVPPRHQVINGIVLELRSADAVDEPRKPGNSPK